jgi:hypothetical protein
MNVRWWHQVSDRIQILKSQVRPLLVYSEPKKLSLAITNSRLSNSQSDGILGANSEEACKIFNELIQVVGIANPVVDVVAMAPSLHLAGGCAIGALGLRTAIILAKG